MSTSDSKVDCQRCKFFRKAPYEAPATGCWHPDHKVVKQKHAFLDQQQVPGNHAKINRDGDCATFEARADKLSWLQRLLAS